jgi:hypothetical protein
MTTLLAGAFSNNCTTVMMDSASHAGFLMKNTLDNYNPKALISKSLAMGASAIESFSNQVSFSFNYFMTVFETSIFMI